MPKRLPLRRAFPSRWVLALAAGLVLHGVAGSVPVRAENSAQAARPAGQPQLPLEPLEIATRNGVLAFEVEVARTPEALSMGLMHRTSLPERRGMLFDFKVEEPVAMWMKNTVLPLDMLFIRSDGTIARIAAMTTPFSTATIGSGEPVQAVLEIIGGSAKRLGIAPGDRVAHPILRRR